MTTKYAIVGSSVVNSQQGDDLNKTFKNLVISDTKQDKYTVFFEPDSEQDGLYFSPQTVDYSYPGKYLYVRTLFAKQNQQTEVELGPKFLTMKISGRYVYNWKNSDGKTNPKLPLPEGTKVVLARGYLSSEFFIEGTKLNDKKILASTTVNKNGEYTFDIGMTDYENFNSDAGKSLVILIDNPYYYAEPTQITYNQNEDIKMPQLMAKVKQYGFKSKLGFKNAAGIIESVKGMEIYLCRLVGTSFTGLPTNEGDPERNTYFKKTWQHTDGKKYQIIDRTNEVDGSFTFNRLVMPSSDPEDKYFILAEPSSTSQENYITENAFPLTGATNFTSLGTFFSPESKKIFSDQQIINTFDYAKNPFYVPIVPQKPYIDGAVYPYSNTSTNVISGVLVEQFDMVGIDDNASETQIVDYLKNKKAISSMVTSSNGRFLFDSLNFDPASGWKLLRLTKSGFLIKYETINSGKPLYKGQRANLGKVYLKPPVYVTTSVVNDAGEFVEARVIVGDDFSWADTKTLSFPGKKQNGFIDLTCPKGLVKFTIIPNNKSIYQTTYVTRNIAENSTQIAPLVVQKALHKVVVICVDKTTNQSVEANVTVTNITETAQTDKFSINGTKITTLSFAAAGSQFDLKVVPIGKYTIAKTKVKSDLVATEIITVYVVPAVSIRCTAHTLAKGQKMPLEDFSVSVEGYDDDEFLRRELNGTVILSKVPANKILTFEANKEGFVGQKSLTWVTKEDRELAFEFKKIPNSLLTSLYAFPVQLTELTEQGNDTYLISGKLDATGNASQSAIKVITNKQWLKFNNIQVKLTASSALDKKVGLESKPKLQIISELIFEENRMDATVFNKYEINILNKNGLSIEGNASGGSIVGQIALEPSTLVKGLYTSESEKEDDKGYLYLNKSTSAYASSSGAKSDYNPYFKSSANQLNTITTSNSSDIQNNSELLVSNSSLKRPTFTAADKLLIIPESNVIMDNSKGISFKGTVNTNLSHVQNANIKAKADFVINQNNFSSQNAEPVTIQLKKWELELQEWNLNNYGFKVNKGILNAQGLTIPFSKLTITHDIIGFGEFNVSDLKILNVFPIKINAGKTLTSFGFDKGFSKEGGAWSVSILAQSSADYLASLKGLPDLNPNDEIKIANINLYDSGNENDTRVILAENQEPVTLNGISSFRPGTVSGGKDFLTFRGDLSLNIPNMSGLDIVTYDLTYKIENNSLSHVHEKSFKNLILDAKGVKVVFSEDGQIFKNGELKLQGILEDKDPASNYKIKVELVKKSDKATYTTSLSVPPNSKIYLTGNTTGSYLDNAKGSMKVVGNSWNNFAFSGFLTGSEGITAEKSEMSFIVKGDIVANSSNVGVQNMDVGGISGLSITYDFKESALVGSGHIHQDTDYASLDLDLELKISSGEWYLFSNGIASDIKNSPISDAAVGMRVGNEKPNSEQLTSLNKHFHEGSVPDGFNGIANNKGVLLVLSVDVPIPVLPSFDIDLEPVAHCEFKHGIYACMYMQVNFTDKSLGVGAKVGGWVKVGAGASIGLACACIALSVDVSANASGSLNFSNKQFLLTFGANLTLAGQAYVGAGVCNSSCQTPCVDLGLTEVCSPIPCVKKGLKEAVVVGIQGSASNDGFNVSLR